MFNWFRRQFNDRDKQEQDQNLPEAPAVTEAESEPEVAEAAAESTPQEDYLKWAKAAYQSIQQRQGQLQEESSAAAESEEVPAEETETPESELVEAVAVTTTEVEEAPQATDSELATEVAEAATEAVEAIAATEPTPETSESELIEAVAETTTEVEEEPQTPESELIEAVAETATEVEEEPQTPESELIEAVAETTTEVEEEPQTPESELTEEVAETTTAATSETESAPMPAWMRKSDALERLKETAIDLPEPEVPQKAAPKTTKPAERPAIPGMDFDEEFIWSAQVLAAQGRKPEDIDIEEISWLKRLRQGLGKTRRGLINQLKAVVGQGPLNADAVTEIETLLLQADVGVEATDYIIETLQGRLRQEALPPEQAIAFLKDILSNLLDAPLQDQENYILVPEKDKLNIWLLTGVNGAGKTTTLGKLAHLAQKSGYRCLIAAADTFRAAAVEQVKVWGDRSNTPVIANPGKNTDPAAVVYDAIAAAQSRNTELLLIDTAGRLQNKKNLMEELAKIRRIIEKKAPDANVESLLVLDATLGQNGLRQAEVFSEAAKLSGAVLTKLDGSAKGGVALAVARELNLPIRFIGAGEGIEDLRPFSSYEFVAALLSE
ncbi:signal recognition particle-docking protein FtsY [Oscillatoria sp. FACHB-1406]|uniref:signal recognition particle-docking protein FtsY n=1 Tax=Oscillatoria sp. FACHB-1406 TaxID=2692846 RepID=UPI0016881188|nr:signal recognition particle-docking protein FtsY [Oscillatoria sp. FACHB-1406]